MDKKIVPIGGGSGVNMADVFNAIYPVGSLYWSMNPTSPTELFGGEWEQIKDRFILAAGDSYKAGDVGGEATVKLITANMPPHTHTRGTMNITGKMKWHGVSVEWEDEGAFSREKVGTGYTWNNSIYYGTNVNFDASKAWTGETSKVGGGEAHNNMPPYTVAYCWERIA